jgi:hypothetical protein
VDKSGYTVTLTAGTASTLTSCNGGTPVQTYWAFAEPLVQDSTGSRHFGTNQGGTIYQDLSTVPETQTGIPTAGTPIQ